jgi:hypothetical protein
MESFVEYNEQDFKNLLLFIITAFSPVHSISPPCSTLKSINIYRQEAIKKWLKKREKRSFAIYKVKTKKYKKHFIRDNQTGQFVVYIKNFISVTNL